MSLLGILAIIIVVGLVIAGIVIVMGLIDGEIELSDIFPGKDKDQKGWYRFDIRKPTKVGWYLCTVEQGSRFPMLLYWDYSSGGGEGRFVDPVRKSVFDTYEVMVTKKFEEGMKTEAIMPDDEYMERIYTDEACDRTKYVIAWKPEPRVFMGEVKNDRNVGRDRANPVTIDAGHRRSYLSGEEITRVSEELGNMLHGKKYDISFEDIEEIAKKWASSGNDYRVSADDLKEALSRVENLNIHNNGRK